MNKKAFNKKIILVLALVLAVSAIIVIAAQISDSGSDLGNGEFNGTYYNATGEFVRLNHTDITNTTFRETGNYTSAVMDFGAVTNFKRIKWNGLPKTCPGNMSYIDKYDGYCIDQYEASMPSANSTAMGNSSDIALRNNPGSTVLAWSRPGVIPWVYVSADSARLACANSGKHLCTSEEWLGAANIKGKIYYLPTGADTNNRIPSDSIDATACVIYEANDCDDHSYSSGDACNTGSHYDCVSAEGVYDLVGNVWEWVNETVTAVCPGASTGLYYPSASGDFQTSTSTDTLKFGNDGVYYSSGTNTGRAVLRGGYWSAGADAGIFIR